MPRDLRNPLLLRIPLSCYGIMQSTTKASREEGSMKITAALTGIMLLVSVGTVFAADAPTAPTKEELAKYATARATITTKFGKIVVKFFPDLAPIHVKNFITLAESGLYNGTPFHRVIPNFMIQGGDPAGNGTGGPGYTIPAEFSSKKHVPGILSMARTSDPNSAGSQFFIMVGTSPSLDGKYSVFGEVVEGLDVVRKIVATPRNRRDKPLETVTMEVQVTY
jgi:peptidyl-prolyl cis-trans isomerase B (cyclophilin B)